MQFEKCRVIRPKPIPKLSGSWNECSMFDDEIIREIARDKLANIFVTDEAAAAIMCSTKAVYSWDVCIKKF